MSRLLKGLDRVVFSRQVFDFFQRLGVHVTPNHFYSPVPDTRALGGRADLWETDSEMPGVDLRAGEQLERLRSVFAALRHECDFQLSAAGAPHDYFIRNGAFGLTSAAVLHCMIRHFAPRAIVEVGSGHSTYVAARAARMNASDGKPAALVAVEPYPNEVLRGGFPGLTRLIARQVQEVGLSLFTDLQAGDILFIDSSHVVRMGNDVVFLFLDVIPRLRKGVVIHVHDIFFPGQYPREWVMRQRRFWAEQYLLQALLACNPSFEVLWCDSLMQLKHPDAVRAVFRRPTDSEPARVTSRAVSG